MTTPQGVIFDIGGVLVDSPVTGVRSFEREVGLADGALRPLLSDHEGAWSRFERSEVDAGAFVAAFETDAAAIGVTVDGAAFLANFFQALGVREDMVAAVRALRGRVALGCITNNIVRPDQPLADPDAAAAADAGPVALVLEDLFDVVIESSKVGLRKPDPRIYKLCCEQLDVAPDQCVFLDDFGVNLKAARALGMITIKVDETDSALRELEAVLGVDLPRSLRGRGNR